MQNSLQAVAPKTIGKCEANGSDYFEEECRNFYFCSVIFCLLSHFCNCRIELFLYPLLTSLIVIFH